MEYVPTERKSKYFLQEANRTKDAADIKHTVDSWQWSMGSTQRTAGSEQ
jgi:hypothetical protein